MVDEGHAGEIHRGGSFLVRRVSPPGGQTVVVKTVSPRAKDPGRAAERLRHEHLLLVRLGGQGVPRVVAWEDAADGTGPRLTLTDAGPSTLAAWCGGQPLDIDRFLTLATRLTEIVAHVHACEIVHRDIYPGNVVVDAQGRPTLVDFDRATSTDASVASDPGADPTRIDPETRRALPYRSPEQLGRLDRPVDARSDLYALGTVFYELLTGAPPFSAAAAAELVHAHVAQRPVPPDRLSASVPAAISAIVLQLLAKMPEDRYPNARPLLADLREAHARRQRSGIIEPFPLGQSVLEEDLPLAPGVFGRSSELARLEAAFERVMRGGREVILLTGPEGIGKTALADALRERVIARGGRFAAGKFELGGSHRPFAALGTALSALLRAFLVEAGNQEGDVHRQIRAALRPGGSVLLPLLPGLGPLVDGPTVPETGAPHERMARFQTAFLGLVGALTSAGPPVVLFLDDLQRADRASLDLVERMASSNQVRRLLLLGTIRTGEAELAPLSPDAPKTQIELEPLSASAIAAFLEQTFQGPPEDGPALAELLRERSGGNPLFLRRLIRDLQQRGAIRTDPHSARWIPDRQAVERLPVSETVAEQMAASLKRLPEDERQVLAAAGCIGARFELDLVAEVLRQAPDATADALRMAARDGYVVGAGEPPPGHLGEPPPGHLHRLQFAHDRIQQAALGLLSPDEQTTLHLRIGRVLADRMLTSDGTDEPVFRAADQIRLAAAALEGPQRKRMAALLLDAGQRAKRLCAWLPALAYLETGIQLLDHDVWSVDPELAFRLHRETVECAIAVGRHGFAEELAARALGRDLPVQQRVDLHHLRILDRMERKDFPAAVACGVDALRALGIDLEPPDLSGAIASNLAAIDGLLAERPIASFENAPLMQSPRLLACMRLLTDLGLPAYMHRPDLWPLLDTWRTRLTLEQGVAPSSAEGLVSQALLWQRLGRDPERIRDLGRLSLAMAHRIGDPVTVCRVVSVFASALSIWIEPADSQIPILRRVQIPGMEAGERLFGATCSLNVVLLSLFRGVELKFVLGEIEDGLELTRRFQVPLITRGLTEVRAIVRQLMDPEVAGSPIELDDSSFSTLAAGAILRLQVAYLLRDLPAARANAELARPHLAALTRATARADYGFYRALSLAEAMEAAGEGERAGWLEEIRHERDGFLSWAQICPDNHRHRHVLLDAEVLRLEGRTLEAAERYEEAIAAAAEARFVQDTALASELAGRFHLAGGRKRLAAHHLRAALDGFARWGARSKVEALREELAGVLAPLDGADRTEDETGSSTELDLDTLFRAAEAISADVTDSQLLDRILQICLSTAGAERGAIVLDEKGTMMVRVFGEIGRSAALTSEPLDRFEDISQAIVEHVRTSLAPMAVADAATHPELACHPGSRRLRSVLGLPLTLRGRFLGVLYLENNLATRVFGPDRVRLLQLLSSQVASAIESSRLFARLNEEIAERTRAIQLRDDFLSIASHELNTPLANLGLLVDGLASGVLEDTVESRTRTIAVMGRQTRRLKRLVDDLLDVAQMRSGRLELRPEAVDLVQAVEGAVELVQEEVRRAGCAIVWRERASVVGKWDRGRLEQITTNLLSNAAKFGSRKPIEIAVRGSETEAELEVVDHGIGIPADRLPHVFERFERAVSASNFGGLGLGLYIVREIVAVMGGRVEVDTHPNAGSRFSVKLPRLRAPA